MSEQQYIQTSTAHRRTEAVPVETDLPGESLQSSSSAYPDITPFTTVSSFSLPATCDSTLLTPVSNGGSPSLRQNSKPGNPYHQSAALVAQQPTPPASHNMPWSSYPMSDDNSQCASPITGDHFGDAYNIGNRDDEIPPPDSAPFFGSFGVSGSTAESDQMEQNHRFMIYSHTQAPMPTQLPSQIVERTSRRNGEPQVMQYPDPAAEYHDRVSTGSQASLVTYPAYASVAPSPKRGGKSKDSRKGITKRPARSKLTPSSGRRGSSQDPRGLAAESELEKRQALERLMARVKPTCPLEERWLIQKKQELREYKGKNHWELITAAYTAEFGKSQQQAALQMRYNRAKGRYIEWTHEEVRILEEATAEYERMRYQTILAMVKERGGCREVEWNTTNIEKKLVELGLEDMYMNPNTKIRRRARINNTANGGKGRAQSSSTAAAAVASAIATANGYVDMKSPQQQHLFTHNQFGLPISGGSDGMPAMSPSPGMTMDQEDDFFGQIKSRGIKAEDISSVEEGDDEDISPMQHLAYHEMETELKNEHQAHEHGFETTPSMRVARQACDQIIRGPMARQDDDYYHGGMVS